MPKPSAEILLATRSLAEYASVHRGDKMMAHSDIWDEIVEPGMEVVEFGLRQGVSTCSFLRRGCVVTSYEIKKKPELMDVHKHLATLAAPSGGRLTVRYEDSKSADIPQCDILLLDALHTGEQVRAELKHAPKVRQWIFAHDTLKYNIRGELPGTGGLWMPLLHLCSTREWQLWHPDTRGAGMWFLKRR